MTTPVRESGTVPAQAAPTEAVAPVPIVPEFDHVLRHPGRCYWDFAQCRWVCHGA